MQHSLHAQENNAYLKSGKFIPDLNSLFDAGQPNHKNKTNSNCGELRFPSDFPRDTAHFHEEVKDRTLRSRTYKNNQNEIVLVNSLKNINYETVPGKLEPICAHLSSSENGWAAVHQPNKLLLNTNGSTSISITQNSFIEFNKEVQIQNQHIDLSNFTVGRDGMYAKSVFPHLDKKVIFQENRIETDYILHEKPVHLVSDFLIREKIVFPEGHTMEAVTSLSYIQNPDGSLEHSHDYIIKNAQGEEMARFEAPYLYDANHAVRQTEYQIQKTENGALLTIAVPQTWLMDPLRKYPVTIDPTVTGPTAIYPAIFLPSCLEPTFSADSMLVTIPANITITEFLVTDSYYADLPNHIVMTGGRMQIKSPCGSTPIYVAGPISGDSAGYAYLPNVDLKSELACCFLPSCNVRTFYVSHHFAHIATYGPGCTTIYIYYSPFSSWPFRIYTVGKTIESTQGQWNISPSTLCSNICTTNLTVTANFGVPPYTLTHPWATGSFQFGTSSSGCSSVGTKTIPLTIPGCPSICAGNVLSVPPPTIIDACGIAVAGYSPKNLTIKAIPDVSATPISICVGDVANITPTSCESTATYAWTGSNGTSGTGSIIDNPSNPGTTPITITYQITPNANGCIGTPASVTAIVNPIPPAPIAGKDTTFCAGLPYQLSSSTIVGASYFWSGPGGFNASIQNPTINTNTNNQGSYEVNVSVNNCPGPKASTLVTIKPSPEIIEISNDTTLCKGSKMELKSESSISGSTFSWSGPSSFTSMKADTLLLAISTSQAGDYTVFATHNGCQGPPKTTKITVSDYPIVVASKDTGICEGESVKLSASGGNKYVWKPIESLSAADSAAPLAKPSATQKYIVTVSNNFCSTNDTIEVIVNPKPTVNAGDDQIIRLSESTTLEAISDAKLIEWTPILGLSCGNCLNPIATPEETIEYTLKVTSDKNCVREDKVIILVEDMPAIYVPNSFTPNDDILNDIFKAYGANIDKFEMRIFDRWGLQLYQSNDLNDGWDGKYKNKFVPSECYVYAIVCTFKNGETKKIKGVVTLVR